MNEARNTVAAAEKGSVPSEASGRSSMMMSFMPVPNPAQARRACPRRAESSAFLALSGSDFGAARPTHSSLVARRVAGRRATEEVSAVKEAIDRLAELPATTPRNQTLSAEDGVAVMKALRRGVSMTQVADALGLRPGNLYSALGAWAARYCKCADQDNGK